MLNLLLWIRSVPAYNLQPDPVAVSWCIGAQRLLGQCYQLVSSYF